MAEVRRLLWVAHSTAHSGWPGRKGPRLTRCRMHSSQIQATFRVASAFPQVDRWGGQDLNLRPTDYESVWPRSTPNAGVRCRHHLRRSQGV